MIIAFNCGIIDTNKPFMIQIFGTQRYTCTYAEKKTLGKWVHQPASAFIKNGERIKGEGKTSKTSKNTSQRRKTQGPGKGLEEAKNRSAPHPGKRVWEGLQTKEC